MHLYRKTDLFKMIFQCVITGNIIMEFKKRIRKILRQYQTRQHLNHLPEHLFEDIKRSSQEINSEVNKNAFVTTLLNAVQHLLTGT